MLLKIIKMAYMNIDTYFIFIFLIKKDPLGYIPLTF